jgi:hypothetical protein
LALVILSVLALAGLALGWNRGRLPDRGEPVATASPHGPDGLAADLALYRDVIADVRSGNSYYDAACRRIPQYGFPISSPLNWRLPTYAWLFARLPGPRWIQAVLVLLSAAALALTCSAQSRVAPPAGQPLGSATEALEGRSEAIRAAVATFLLFGALRWAVDGYAFLAQEPWAATLIALSLAAHARGSDRARWRWLSIVAGIAALLFRELALPYCGIACLAAAWNRRWREAAGWSAGIALFAALMAWHIGQVKLQLASQHTASGAGLAQWLRFGGLDFVLLTTRMNSLLFAAPASLLWLYLLLSLVGLAHRRDETSQLACLAALSYVVAFAIVGRPENFYWGLMPAPLLAWGVAAGPAAIAGLYRQGARTRSRHALREEGTLLRA